MNINRMEEQKADYKVYKAAGSHREIGLVTARKAGTLIAPAQLSLNKEQRQLAEKCRDIARDIYPEIIDEFIGYSEGVNVKEEDLLWHYSFGVTGGCSALAVMTPSGILVGRNYDFYYWENRRHLIHTQPDKGFSHIGMHEGLVGGRFDGINEKGLFISFNGAGPHPEPATPGLSFHLIIRYILEKCSNADEAKEALYTLPIKEPKSYLAVDKTKAFVIEAHPERRECRQMENGFIAVTNHFIHPSMVQYQKGWPNSIARYKKLIEAGSLLHSHSDHPADILKKVLTDHDAPVCGHEDGLATFWSCLADIEKKEIHYALGAPCRNEYKEYFRSP